VSAIFGVHLKKEIFQILGKAMLFQRRGIYDSSELQIVNLQRLGIREPPNPYPLEKPFDFSKDITEKNLWFFSVTC